MKSLLLLVYLSILAAVSANAQEKMNYKDSLLTYQQNYVTAHEVVKHADKKYFQFYPIKEKYCVNVTLTPIVDSVGFNMKTSGTKLKKYYRFGKLSFAIGRKNMELTLYSSELASKMTDSTYLFLPFTDITSGDGSYAGGRYINLFYKDISNNQVQIDFNKAYNPYCAYTTGYNCPIPPRENHLNIRIEAGEKDFAKPH